jgi:hypothetical protein
MAEKNVKHSYTSVNDFQICKSRYHHKYVLKDVPYETTPALAAGVAAHKAFEQRLTAGRQFEGPDAARYESFAKALDGRRLHVELRLGIRADGTTCGFYDDDCWFCCKADAVMERPLGATVFDWKTGSSSYENPFELRVQAVMLRARWHFGDINGYYVWLKDNRIGTQHNLNDTARTLAEMRAIVGMIEESRAANFWPEREGPMCGYCPVTDCRFNRKRA